MDVAYCELAGLTTYFFTQAAHMGARLMFALQNIVSRQIRLNLAQKTEE